MYDKEIEVLRLLLSELYSQLSNGLHVFNCWMNNENIEDEDWDDEKSTLSKEKLEEVKKLIESVKPGKYRKLNISWSPYSDSNHPYNKNIREITISYIPVEGVMSVLFNYEPVQNNTTSKSFSRNVRHNRDVSIGFCKPTQAHWDIKRLFLNIYNRIDIYMTKEKPLEEIDEFTHSVYDAFPHLMLDKMLRGNNEEISEETKDSDKT